MFQIEEFTEARLTSVTNRTEKHGDEDVPAVSLACEITAANTLLDGICPGLRHALYKAVEDQDELPGVEPATPVLRTNVIDSVALTTAHEGWRLLVDDGIDDTTPMEFGGVKVDKLKVDAKQGGSIVLKLRLGTSDIDADRLGKLGMHNGQSIWVKLLKPDPKPDVIDGTVGHPGAAGQSSLLDDDGAADDGASTGDDGLGGFDDDMGRGADGPQDAADEQPTDPQRGANWPFPTGGAKTDEKLAAELEQAEIEAGMAQSIAASGVAPKGGRKPRKTAAVGAVE